MNMQTKQIGTFEVKTHLSQILSKVEKGEDFIITRRGKPVAKIIPFEEEKKMTRREAVEAMIEMRKHYNGEPGSFNLKKALEEGRRF
jgi:prevent-host-death family protein